MKIYHVASGDWGVRVEAKNIMEAATVGVEHIYKRPQGGTFGAVVMVWEEKYKIQNLVEKQYFVFAPTVLANAGKYNDAKLLEKKIDQTIKASNI